MQERYQLGIEACAYNGLHYVMLILHGSYILESKKKMQNYPQEIRETVRMGKINKMVRHQRG